ncbi:efflux RND transporter periplasmic adaptor subunit [Couchioplanes caeruleus]|uniref:Efflux transporter periplasmic adaptor subunit n=2 Tax=Couchioplanes caeruleus TaxID=56438 RepID=A0A1K0GS18_9ACTN|nr:HlyD family efflux transporter periplasmic adaptor subunit [Couchioplanes caeruleus]OJF14012.1 efflux transporter periplasmic adaptor subunit [Couchioplanes caeruleus subsp. caeruleus]ROP34348.1 RND family efflux transporter MFP subunit [Couchioplanes caeruleus]
MSRSPRRATVLLLACLLLPPLTAASCGDEPSGVTVGTAGRGTVDEIVEAAGSVTVRAAGTVTSPADGTLEELRVDAGDRVRKGQVVAVVDSPAAEKRLDDATEALDAVSRGGVSPGGGAAAFAAVRRRTDANAGRAFAAARKAAAEVTDATLRKALLAQVTAAEEQYAAVSAAAGAAVRSLESGVASVAAAVDALTAAQRVQARQAYELAEAAVDALTLRAPVSGVVQLGGTASAAAPSLTDLLSSADPAAVGTPAAAPPPGVDVAVPQGAAVGVGTPILTVVDTAGLGVAAEVDETDVLLVKAGGSGTVELDAATGATYEARVRAVDLLPSTSARGGVSYRVRLTLGRGTYADGTAAPVPRPGMSAIVRLRVRQATDAVTVPAGAVVSRDGRDGVWAVRGGKAERVPVTLGVQGEDLVQVVSGLGAGERIVVAGADQVSPGQDLP